MKSPVTGKEMELQREFRTLHYRKEPFEVVFHYYLCTDSGEQFTTTELDNLNLLQVHNQYRAKYAIPFVDEIKAIRNKYDLSAAKMSVILGFGANVYRNYEAGEMPSVSTGRMIRMAEDPREFLRILDFARNELDETDYNKVQRKIYHALEQEGTRQTQVEQWLFETTLPTIYNGYRMPSLEKVGRMVAFLAGRNKPFLTALNKLMFYADFLHFQKCGAGISGLYYHAIQKGPVPNNYGSIYNCLVNDGYIKIEEVEFKDFVGEQFSSGDKEKAVLSGEIFSATEIEILKQVAQRFKGMNTRQIVEISHTEKAWQHNIDSNGRINYVYGFILKQIE